MFVKINTSGLQNSTEIDKKTVKNPIGIASQFSMHLGGQNDSQIRLLGYFVGGVLVDVNFRLLSYQVFGDFLK